jgi:hypothetical protein
MEGLGNDFLQFLIAGIISCCFSYCGFSVCAASQLPLHKFPMLERNLKRVQEFPSPEKDIFHKWRLGFWAVMDGLINACQIYLANAEWLNLGS